VRSPATPSINTEHPSLNERVFPIPFRTPALILLHYPSVSCSRVRQLQCYEIGLRERDERGRMGRTGVVSRRRYRPLSNPVTTLKGNHRKRGCGAFNSSRFRFIFDISQKEKEGGFFYSSLYYRTLLCIYSIVDATCIFLTNIFKQYFLNAAFLIRSHLHFNVQKLN